MKRMGLVLAVVVVAAVAFYLRFAALVGQPEAGPGAAGSGSAASQSAWMPRDYVVNPQVDPTERDNGPRRIISMAPSATELCCALGLAERLVGRTQFCQYPPSLRRVEVVGGYADPNLEKIVALSPELVLITASSARLREKLGALELPIKELPDSSLEDIFRAIELLGKYTDRPKTAAGLVRALRRDLDRLSRRRPARSLRVLVVVGAMPTVPGAVYVAGPGSYLDSIIRLAGHSNALQGRLDRPWAQVSVEALVAAGPEAILESRADSSPAAMERLYRAWSDFAGSIPALRDRRICCIADESILIPGPRVNIALWRVMRALAGRGGAD